MLRFKRPLAFFRNHSSRYDPTSGTWFLKNEAGTGVSHMTMRQVSQKKGPPPGQAAAGLQGKRVQG